jgi:hypothetical protein
MEEDTFFYKKYLKYKMKYLNKKYLYGGEKEPILIDNIEKINKYYPDEENIDKTKLKMTDVGLYSITPYYEAEETVNNIKKLLPENIKSLDKLILTETNGGVGGDSIIFTKYFKKVNIIELSKMHCDVLKNNLSVYKRKNYKLYCKDSGIICPKLKQDIVYMDPPWGGPEYKTKNLLKLYMGKYSIEELLLNMKFIMAIIKVPFNFDFDSFEKIFEKDHNINKFKKRNYFNIFIVKK